jgi:hypothetical protein
MTNIHFGLEMDKVADAPKNFWKISKRPPQVSRIEKKKAILLLLISTKLIQVSPCLSGNISPNYTFYYRWKKDATKARTILFVYFSFNAIRFFLSHVIYSLCVMIV